MSGGKGEEGYSSIRRGSRELLHFSTGILFTITWVILIG
jgi:hypothetical protein